MTLSPLDREAVLLTAWFDLSSADAARALGITPAAYRMRTARARRRLRAAHLDHGPGSPNATRRADGRSRRPSPQSRPDDADVDADAFDADLLARVRSTPHGRAAASRAARSCCPWWPASPSSPRPPCCSSAAPAGRRPVLGRRDHADPPLAGPAGRHDPARQERRDRRRPDAHARVLAVRRRLQPAAGGVPGLGELRDRRRRDVLRPRHQHHLRRAQGAADKPRADGTPRAGRSRPRTPPRRTPRRPPSCGPRARRPSRTDGGAKPAPSSDTQRAKAEEAAANGVGKPDEPLPVGDPSWSRCACCCRTTG